MKTIGLGAIAAALTVSVLVMLPSPAQAQVEDKWSLWSGDTPQLRGANVYQRRVYPDLDDGYIGPGAFGPPYAQAEFDELAGLGCNFVNLSHPGLFTEEAPFAVDAGATANLDALLAMIEAADMFAVISFRTGPGRNEFTLTGEGGDESEWPESRKDDSLWTEPDRQDAWVAMWSYVAGRYAGHSIVVGYDLMVEPNPAGSLLDIGEPDEFYATYANTLYDWNQLHPRIAAAIRAVDGETPIIVGGMNWSSALWMPYLAGSGVERTVYAVHQYEPRDYTHQDAGTGVAYPGAGSLTTPMAQVDQFRGAHGNPPVTANEYGVHRFAPDAATFMRDQMEQFEARGISYALWDWTSAYPTQQQDNDDFDITHGPDPNNHTAVPNELLTLVQSYWSRNSARPSNVDF